MTMAAIYVRQSKDTAGDGVAVDRQLAACRKLAEAREAAVSEEFVENDTSASQGNRPEFDRLLREIEAGHVDTIIVWHTDRLYRRVHDLVRLMDIADTHDLQIVTVKGGDLDLTTPTGRMFASLTASVARYEVEHKGERQIAANVQRAEAGVWQFTNRPFGYRRIDGRVEQVPHEADALREMYRRYLAGDSYYSIAQWLNSENITTSTGKAWSITLVRERLRNPANAGILEYYGTPRKGEKRRKAPFITAEGNWEPIIDRATWDAYTRMRNRRGTKADWSNKTRWLLSGLLECGVCGDRLLARPEYRKRDGERITTMAYACRANYCTQRNLTRMDALVDALITERFRQPDVLELLRVEQSLADETAALDALRTRWDNLAELVADGTLPPTAAREQGAKLRDQITALENRIAAERERSTLTELALADDVAETWSRFPITKKRRLIQQLLRIRVHKQSNPRRFNPAELTVEWVSEGPETLSGKPA